MVGSPFFGADAAVSQHSGLCANASRAHFRLLSGTIALLISLREERQRLHFIPSRFPCIPSNLHCCV